ncbi:GTP cyclohydrolase I FolE [Streptomyces sp. NPDC005271]|uniref:GTP cyclohydrolase I n=1 Tax=unclassified Streptomyces TaxID=2593676 RepID=UPI0033BA4681
MTNAVASPITGLGAAVAPPALPATRIDTGRVSDLIAQLLVELGEDPAREGLAGTPERVAAWWKTFLSTNDSAPATCFVESHLSDQLVVVGGMSVWSLCEHHLLPMNLHVTAGYVPDGEVVGLSKFGRIAQRHAGQLQVQERFTRQVAKELTGVIGREDIAVTVRGAHLCMSMRGVRMEDARTITVHAGGRFGTDPVLSQQFLTIAAGQWGAM